jgi:microcystin-dependent protein
VTGLQTALDAKSDTHSHPYAADDHNHDSAYSAVDHTHPGGGSALDAWPVGSVYIAVDSTSPATRFGGGTWQAFGAGRMLVGLDSGDADFDTAEETGGAKTVTLTAAQSGLPQHTHTQNAHNHTQDAHTHQFLPRSGTTGSVSSIVTGTLDTSSTISGANQPHIQSATATNQAATAVNQNAGPTDASQAHSNVPPYIVVYMWKRTA